MATFRYSAYSKSGDHKTGSIEANSEVDASQQISAQGLMPYLIEADTRWKFKKRGQWLSGRKKPRFSIAEFETFFSGLVVLLESGFVLDDGCAPADEDDEDGCCCCCSF